MSGDEYAADFYCGLGGWADGFLAEGIKVIGFDIERHDYGTGGYPGQLVLQDVLSLHGSQFKDALCLVASPPCTEYSYMAMPWKRAKQIAGALREEVPFPKDYRGSRTIEQLNALFNACFRIQREASAAAGRHIPLIVENVRGAQPWVGRAQWHFGSYFLWGDVPALMPKTFPIKVKGQDWNHYRKTGTVSPHWRMEGLKQRGSGAEWWRNGAGALGSQSAARKAASANLAKIPFELARWIARCYYRSGATNGDEASMAGTRTCGIDR